jgi:hypothetical protein
MHAGEHLDEAASRRLSATFRFGFRTRGGGGHLVRSSALRQAPKAFGHPVVGEITVGWEILASMTDPDQQLLVMTAEPGSPPHQALRFLASWAARSRGRRREDLAADRASPRRCSGIPWKDRPLYEATWPRRSGTSATVSAIATATSTALEAAIPAISVSGVVAIARIPSAASASGRERGACPSLAPRKSSWASRKSEGRRTTRCSPRSRCARGPRVGYGQAASAGPRRCHGPPPPLASYQTRSLTKCSPSALPRRAPMRNAARTSWKSR